MSSHPETPATDVTQQLLEQLTKHNQLMERQNQILGGIERAVTGLGIRWDDVHLTMEARNNELMQRTGQGTGTSHCEAGTRDASTALRMADAARILRENSTATPEG